MSKKLECLGLNRMPPLPCDLSTRLAPLVATPTCSQCKIVAQRQETTRLVITKRVVGLVLDVHKAENEAYKSAIEAKLAKAAAYRAATEELKKVYGNPSTKQPPK